MMYRENYISSCRITLEADKQDHRVIQVWRDLWRSPVWSLSKQGQLWGQTWLLRNLSSLVLKTFKDGDYRNSLGILFQCLAVLAMKKFLFISGLNRSCFNLCLLSLILPPMHHHGKSVFVFLMVALQVLEGCYYAPPCPYCSLCAAE